MQRFVNFGTLMSSRASANSQPARHCMCQTSARITTSGNQHVVHSQRQACEHPASRSMPTTAAIWAKQQPNYQSGLVSLLQEAWPAYSPAQKETHVGGARVGARPCAGWRRLSLCLKLTMQRGRDNAFACAVSPTSQFIEKRILTILGSRSWKLGFA